MEFCGGDPEHPFLLLLLSLVIGRGQIDALIREGSTCVPILCTAKLSMTDQPPARCVGYPSFNSTARSSIMYKYAVCPGTCEGNPSILKYRRVGCHNYVVVVVLKVV